MTLSWTTARHDRPQREQPEPDAGPAAEQQREARHGHQPGTEPGVVRDALLTVALCPSPPHRCQTTFSSSRWPKRSRWSLTTCANRAASSPSGHRDLDLEGAVDGAEHQHLAGVPPLHGRPLLGRDGPALGPVADELLGVALGSFGGHRAVDCGHLLPLGALGGEIMPGGWSRRKGRRTRYFRCVGARAGGESSAATTAGGGAVRRGSASRSVVLAAALLGATDAPRRWRGGRGRGRWRGSR